jgi:Asp-tRNA(Asn)/Glu-tRNA(Gln) amidotransferase A subunit family amidase
MKGTSMLRTASLVSALLLSGCTTYRDASYTTPGMPLVEAAPDTATGQTLAAIDRIRRIDPRLNSVIAIDPTAVEEARALDRGGAPRGPLWGVPVLIKDNIEMKGRCRPPPAAWR